MPLDGGVESRVEGLPNLFMERWGVTETGIMFLDINPSAQSGKRLPVKLWDRKTRTMAVMGVLPEARWSSMSLSITRDGSTMVWDHVAKDTKNTDLMLIDNFR
jgi:hypothetical protein